MTMSFDDRLDALRTKHETLAVKIDTEEKRRHPDELHLHKLKKQKLLLKDEITELSARA